MLDYDRRLRKISFITEGTYVFLDSATLVTVTAPSAEAMANHTYRNLLVRITALDEVVSVQKSTLTIGGKGIPQCVSIALIAHATSSFQLQLDESHNSTNQSVSVPRNRNDLQAKNQSVAAPATRMTNKTDTRANRCFTRKK